jgi:murein DD-endopeptidase MepM/ murein hydrolase activator NlpD
MPAGSRSTEAMRVPPSERFSSTPEEVARTAAPVLAVRRSTLAAVGIGFAVLTLWGAGTAWYILFRDHLAARFIARQTEMQYVYEEKLAAMRARLDRVASQKLLEQDSVETRVADLVARQMNLENRQAVLASLAEQAGGPTVTGTVRNSPAPVVRTRPELPPSASAYAPLKPTPVPEPFGLRLKDSDPTPSLGFERQSRREDDVPVDIRLAGVERSLTLIDMGQLRTIDGLMRSTTGELSRLRAAVADVGLDPQAVQPRGRDAVGGPLVPIAVDPKAGPFEALVSRAQASVAQLDRLRRVTTALPFGRPMPGDPDLTSGFGYRSDPFTRRPAMHTGLDFRADHGAPVRATAGGTVVAAERDGGYGNMVEIDHGNGVSTRYAHLSAISVSEGDSLSAGAVVGRVGTTGRSTGPHLHYETRINDEAVDPQRFLRAGARLAMARYSAEPR